MCRLLPDAISRMAKMAPSIAILLTLVLATLATAASAQSSCVEVIDQRPIDLGEDVLPAQLSPDGRWIAGWDLERLCFYEVVSLDAVSCVEYDDPRLNAFTSGVTIDVDWISWSSDGSRVAFTENVRSGRVPESDILVLDVESGVLVNLTDDGVGGALVGGLDASHAGIDFSPTWSPDGESVAFARSTATQVGDEVSFVGTSILRVPASGGEPEMIAQVADQPLAIFGMEWAPNGAGIVYAAVDGSAATLEVVDVATGAIRRVIDSKRIEDELRISQNSDVGFVLDMTLLNVSAQGMALVGATFVTVNGQGEIEGVVETVLVDLELGTVSILRSRLVHDESSPAIPPYLVTFSPDGTHLLYTVRDPELSGALVSQEIGWSGQLLLTDIEADGFNPYRWGFTWATNDTVLLPGEELLVRLASR